MLTSYLELILTSLLFLLAVMYINELFLSIA